MVSILLGALARHAPFFLAGGVFLGLLLPDLAAFLRPALGPIVAVLLGVSLLRIDWASLYLLLRRPGIAAITTLWHLGVSPLLVWAATFWIGLPPGLFQSLVLNGAASALVGSATLAQLIGLDAALSVILVVTTTFLLPLTLPPVVFWLLGIELTIDLARFYLRFLLFIGLPFLAAVGIRALFPAVFFQRHAGALDGLSVVILLLAALAMMDGVLARLLAAPTTVGLFLLAAVIFNLGFQALGALVFWRRGPQQAFSLGLAAGNRNMALMLVLTGDIFGPDLALYVAMAQIPVYLLPLFAKPLYRRWAA